MNVETRELGGIAVDVAGTGPLVLFLHGVGGNRSNWAAQLGPVAAAGFTAAAWDMPGYGGSTGPATPGFPAYASAAATTIAALGHAHAHIVGLSMGGRIALDLIARHRARVASLTLADCSAGRASVADPARVAAMLEARVRPLREGRAPAELAPALTDEIAGPHASPAARTALLRSHAGLRPAGYIAALEAVTAFADFPPWPTIDAPTLVIAGEHDRLCPPAYAAEVAAAIPGARAVVLAGAGHVSNLEAPEAFNAALLAFLGEAE